MGGLAGLMELTVPLGLLLVNEHMKKRMPASKAQKGGDSKSASKKEETKPASKSASKKEETKMEMTKN